MDAFAPAYFANLAAALTQNALSAAARRIRREISGDKGEQAFNRCIHAGIVAAVSRAALDSGPQHQLLKDIFTRFFEEPDTGKELIGVLTGKPPDMDELELLFQDAGYDPETLPGVPFKEAMHVFEAAFLQAAMLEPPLRPLVQTGHIMEQTRIQGELLSLIREIVDFVRNNGVEQIGIKADTIIAQNVVNGEIVQSSSYTPNWGPPDSNDWEAVYLKNLIKRCDAVDLTAVESFSAPDGSEAEPVRLSDVFTTLYLKQIERYPDQPVADAVLGRDRGMEGRERENRERIPVQAVEAAGAVNRIIVLGRPGGGKSTLVNHLTVQLARRRKGEGIGEDVLPGWPPDERPLPVRIILRHFAEFIPADCKRGTGGLVWEFLKQSLADWGAGKFHARLEDILNREGGVIFFDGLDEVRETDEAQKRRLIVDAIDDFARSLDRCKVMITCREYAYRGGSPWRLPEKTFPVVELDLFRTEQIRMFTQTWYQTTGRLKGWNEEKRLAEAEELFQAVENWPHLKDLGRYPLLLTLMAQVHGRAGYLPRDRADLYERAVNLLLAHWENRIVRDLDGSCRVEPGLVMKLGVRIDALWSALEQAAQDAHERQESDSENQAGCADIPREDLRQSLKTGLDCGLDRAEEVIGYIQNRAGLLHALDNKTFAFPHRTFQEYLAAVGIMKKENFEEYLRERIERNPAWWWEVFLLAAGSSRNVPRNVYMMIDTLLPDDPGGETPITVQTVTYARLAPQALGETEFVKHARSGESGGRYAKIVRRIQNWLLAAMAADDILKPQERCGAGNALNYTGDPRFNPDQFYLPKGPDLGFVTIPAEKFLMGGEKEEAETGEYRIGKYPVTVAQFRVFIEETGYDARKSWKNDPDNHPVRYVSWNDANAYCKWLTEKLKDRGWKIGLPDETQWEKAARGTDGREYPYGDKPDKEKMNCRETGLGTTTSPVGGFSGGASPYGILDMSGNLWEWTSTEDGALRVLRGGAWDCGARNCRSANRPGDDPGGRNGYDGFRLLCLPGHS